MLTIGIGAFALFLLYVTIGNGEWGSAALVVVITLILIALAAEDRRDTKAWANRQRYWANGGPEQYRKRR